MSDANAPQSTPPVLQAQAFAVGTLILTPNGPEFIESLVPGDLVMTRDGGPQPLARVTQTTPVHVQCVLPLGDGAPWRHLWLAAPAEGTATTTARACITLHCKTGQVIWAEGLPVKIAPVTKPKAQAKPPVMA